MPTPGLPVHIAVALEGAGWHPAAWREPGARPVELFAARYWAGLAGEAERGLLDFVTFEDSLSLQSADPAGPPGVRGDPAAARLACDLAPYHRDFMTEHHDLGVLGRLATAQQAWSCAVRWCCAAAPPPVLVVRAR